MIKFITSFVFVSLSLMAFSQSVVVSNTQTPTQLINNVLLGMGVTASNITINGSPLKEMWRVLQIQILLFQLVRACY